MSSYGRLYRPILSKEEQENLEASRESRREASAERAREYMASQELNRMIMDVEVTPSPEGDNYVRLKFLAITGGCGPEVTMERGLAEKAYKELGRFLYHHA